MSVEIIDTLVPKNNGKFPVVDSNHIAGGYYHVNTISELQLIPEERRKLGMMCYVADEGNIYILERSGWGIATFDSIHIGPEEPLDTNLIWADTDDEDLDNVTDPVVLEEIRKSLEDVTSKTDEVYYALNRELDPGYFGGVRPGEDLEVKRKTVQSDETPDNSEDSNPEGEPPLDFGDTDYPEGYEPDLGGKATVQRIRLKRGLKQNLEKLFEGELGFCIDTEELYVGNNGLNKLIAKVGGVGGSSSSSNVTGEYIELIASDKRKYRLLVNNDGDLQIIDSEAFTSTLPELDEAPRFEGLVINHVYGGGARKSNIPYCSHGFIELYNKTENPINLRGLSLQYGEKGKEWQVFPLRGIIKPLHSFLVRCAEHTDINRKTTRFKIRNYDMHWDIPLSNNGMKVYLGVGDTKLTVPNPANIDNLWTKQLGYIDLFAFGSTNPALTIDAYEKSGKADGFLQVGDMHHSVHRKDFIDTNSSFLDLEAIDLRTADVATYTPRCTKDGQWISYYNKLKLSEVRPTMINLGYGKDALTSRTFTWHTKPTPNGFLLYKKKGDAEFTRVPTTKTTATYYDTDATVHRVILHGLTPGTYVYKAGEEGMWSDEYEFEVKTITDDTDFSFLMTTDQQGINEQEYDVWRKANEVICSRENFDFTINTGDISNDGGEFAYQWRYYYDFAKDNLYSTPHMTCCGNNDLTRNDVDKKKTDPVAFTWYSTYEDEHLPSCYSWNYGYVHFVSLNSNLLQDPEIVEKQIPWLREDLSKPENKKRWTIVYMHESPYTIIRQEKLSKFVQVFAEFGVDLVLCGHHHRYSRSHRMGAETSSGEPTFDNTRGCYYVMCQATGYKLMGKVSPAEDSIATWRAKYDNVGNPMYIMWDVSYSQIVMRPYSIANILPETDNEYNSPEVIPFNDTLVITKPY